LKSELLIVYYCATKTCILNCYSVLCLSCLSCFYIIYCLQCKEYVNCFGPLVAFTVCLFHYLFHVYPIPNTPQTATTTSHALEATCVVVIGVHTMEPMKSHAASEQDGTSQSRFCIVTFSSFHLHRGCCKVCWRWFGWMSFFHLRKLLTKERLCYY